MTFIWLILIALLILIATLCIQPKEEERPIYLGLLIQEQEQTSEAARAIREVMDFAIAELNAKYGVQLVLLERHCDDIKSCLDKTVELKKQGVVAIFGCETELCKNKLAYQLAGEIPLFYPSSALNVASGVVHTGMAFNQQLSPMISWAISKYGTKVYLIGDTDSVANRLMMLSEHLITAYGGELVGARLFTNETIAMLAQEIRLKQPSVVINLIRDDRLPALFRMLEQEGVDVSQQPVFSLNLNERVLNELTTAQAKGLYTSNFYFQDLLLPSNQVFLTRFQSRGGSARAMTARTMSYYLAAQLWATSALQNKQEHSPMKALLQQQSVLMPYGKATVDFNSKFVWHKAYITQVNALRSLDFVWQSEQYIHPEPMCRMSISWCEQ